MILVVVWCVVCGVMRHSDRQRYQVDKIPPYLLSHRVTRVYAFSLARSATVTVTLRSNI